MKNNKNLIICCLIFTIFIFKIVGHSPSENVINEIDHVKNSIKEVEKKLKKTKSQKFISIDSYTQDAHTPINKPPYQFEKQETKYTISYQKQYYNFPADYTSWDVSEPIRTPTNEIKPILPKCYSASINYEW